MQRRARQMAALQSELTRLAFSGPNGADFDAVQTALVRGACEVLESEHCALILIDETNPGWMISKSLGDNGEWAYQISAVDGPGLVRECLRTRQLVCANALESEPHFEPGCDGWGERPAHSLLCAPLVIHDQAFGALKLVNRVSDSFDAYDQDLLALLAVQVSNIFQGIRTLQQLKVTNADLEANRWELLGSRNTLRAIFDHLPVGMYIIDPDYHLAAVNRGRAARVEQTPRSLVGQVCYQVLFGRATPCLECRVMETLLEARNTQRSERRFTGSDEASDWEISTYPIRDEDERVIQAILLEQDVTERRRLESILTQSEKLAAIGQLAAGVAHEINNPLTAIIANSQILHRELPANSDLQESVDLIARAGARAAQVVRNLLDFARKEEYHLGLTDLNETVSRALELVQHEILARGVHLEFAPDPELPPMLASQDHLQSVWLNLLLNAIDSLDKSPGEIKITTRRVGGEVHISVTDNGKGIPPDRLPRIFEPFYTTKAAGRGTGLGLSVSHRIIKQHGGRIGVESQVGVGSVFTVMLPTS